MQKPRQDKVQRPTQHKAVASFVDPRTHARINVFPKRGETAERAIERVKRKHGAS